MIVLATIVAYWRVKDCGFLLYDDPQYLTESAQVQQGFTLNGIRWAVGGIHFSNWHPLTTLSFMAEYQVWGLRPGPYHLANLALHLAGSTLLGIWLIRATGAVGRSAFVAGLFALHPAHVESVAWISERKDVLSGVFFMLVLLAYTRYAQRPGASRYLLVALLLSLGLMSKAMLVTTPALLLLLDYWPLRRIDFGQRGDSCNAKTLSATRAILEKCPLFVLALASSVITFVVQRYSGATASAELVPPSVRIANALLAYVSYLRMMFWPSGLAIFYPLTGDVGRWPLALIVLTTITALVIWQARRRPYLAVGWFWYLGTMVPVIGFVQVGDQALADRYTYLPYIGLFIMAAWGGWDLLVNLRRPATIGWITGTATLALLGIATWFQVGYWKDTRAAFRRALDVVPANPKAHVVLGTVAYREKDLPTALRHFQKAVEIRSDYPDGLNKLGVAYITAGKQSLAVKTLEESIQILTRDIPDSQQRLRDGRYREAVYNLGVAHLQQDHLEAAEGRFLELIRADDQDAEAHELLSATYIQMGRLDDAIAHARAALDIDPRRSGAHFNLGRAHARRGERAEAADSLRRAIELEPANRRARGMLIDVLIALGRDDDAIGLLDSAVAQAPDDETAHLRLGVLLYARGRTSEALAHYRSALRINHGSAALNNLAWAMSTHPQTTIRNGPEAIALATRYISGDGKGRADAFDTLAAAYAEAGRFEDAVTTARDAIALAEKAGQPQFAEQVRGRLALYERRQPYRDDPQAATQPAP
jgi:tetratricopeptide (TPR) repeat protein